MSASSEKNAVLFGGVFLAAWAGYFFYPALNPFHATNVQAVFSPEHTESTLSEILSGSERTLDVMMYEFSYSPWKEALTLAAKRGVRVRLILEKSVSANLMTAEQLALSGVAVRWSSKEFATTHAKLVISDGFSVLVGSPNWSRHAMKLNREAAAWIQDQGLASAYENVFESDWQKAVAWKP